MKVLVIGGCHTYGFGVDFGEGFVQQVASELGKSATEVTLDYYAPAKMSRIGPLLAHLDNQLSQYDLIVLQPGHFELIHRYFKDLFRPVPADLNPEVYHGHIVLNHQTHPTSVHLFHEKLPHLSDKSRTSPIKEIEHQYKTTGIIDRLRQVSKRAIVALAHQLGRIERLAYMEQMLNDALAHLKFHRSRVILVTPMPVQNKFMNQLRYLANSTFARQGKSAGVTVVDSFESLSVSDATLLPDGCHLNSVGHTQLADAVLLACQRMGLLSTQPPAKALWSSVPYYEEF